jgi:hypothetical protein
MGAPAPATAVLALQRWAGNRAVRRILAREPRTRTPPKTPPNLKGRGAGSDAGKQSDTTAAQLKLLENRQDLKRRIGDKYDDIYDLRLGLIEIWKDNAHAEDPPNRWSQFIVGALGVVIAMVSEGIGGIVYGVIHKMVDPKKLPQYVKDFTTLAGLEAGDLAAEIPLRAALGRVEHDLLTGSANARGKVADTFKEDALKKIAEANKSDVINTYAAVMREQAHLENDATKQAFDDEADSKSLQELREKWAAQQIVHDQLLKDPEEFLQQLTLGYTAMLDRARLADQARGSSESEVLQKDANRSQLSVGIIDLKPDKPGESYDHFLGTWSSPNLDFPGFRVGVYGLNQALDKDLLNLKAQDLPPRTLRVRFRAANAYSGWFTDQQISVSFVIDKAGAFHVMEGENAREWLSSYYTGWSREHSDEERDTYAPRGANKLWTAIKAKPLLWIWDD